MNSFKNDFKSINNWTWENIKPILTKGILAALVLDFSIIAVGTILLYLNDTLNQFECSAVQTHVPLLFQLCLFPVVIITVVLLLFIAVYIILLFIIGMRHIDVKFLGNSIGIIFDSIIEVLYLFFQGIGFVFKKINVFRYAPSIPKKYYTPSESTKDKIGSVGLFLMTLIMVMLVLTLMYIIGDGIYSVITSNIC